VLFEKDRVHAVDADDHEAGRGGVRGVVRAG
jgi:hypothetical protein